MMLFVFLYFGIINLASAAIDKPSNVPTYKISVDAKLYSHFIDRGLSISNRNPALNAAFLFNLGPQFRLGFWGSNISNITSTDDNFWFKFMADVKVDFNQTSNLLLYLHDDHFYKSSLRNGQSIGVKISAFKYLAEIEWQNNFQGTKTDAVYLNLGKLYELKTQLSLGGKVGYTMQNSSDYSNYFDFKALAQYEVNKNSIFEAGFTITSNSSQLDGRGEPAMYISIALSN